MEPDGRAQLIGASGVEGAAPTADGAAARAWGQDVVAVYDLDSLFRVTLPDVLAIAATTWRATAATGDTTPLSGRDLIDRWLEGWPGALTDEELRSTYANALYGLASTSRCEHAVDPDERLHVRGRPALRAESARLLAAIGRVGSWSPDDGPAPPRRRLPMSKNTNVQRSQTAQAS